jgi:hypothetical protein
MTLKFAALIAGKPYNYTRASRELTDWVNEVYLESPALNISYCSFSKVQSPPTAVVHLTSFDNLPEDSDEGDVAAMALEPSMANVSVQNARTSRPRGPKLEPTPRAQFINNMVNTLVHHHGHSFTEAFKAAEDCWKKYPRKHIQELGKRDNNFNEANDEEVDEETLKLVPQVR